MMNKQFRIILCVVFFMVVIGGSICGDEVKIHGEWRGQNETLPYHYIESIHNSKNPSSSEEVQIDLKLINNTSIDMNLSRYKIIYYYSTEKDTDQIIDVQWTPIGELNINANYVKTDYETPFVNGFIEITFTESNDLIRSFSELPISIRVRNEDTSKYNLENDLSYLNKNNGYIHNERIQLYSNDYMISESNLMDIHYDILDKDKLPALASNYSEIYTEEWYYYSDQIHDGDFRYHMDLDLQWYENYNGFYNYMMAIEKEVDERNRAIEIIQLDPYGDYDGDGLPNYFEWSRRWADIDPVNIDYDQDGIPDGDEDYDQDGLTNLQEYMLGTYLTLNDSDEDGLSDGFEISNRLNLISGISKEQHVHDSEIVFEHELKIDPEDFNIIVHAPGEIEEAVRIVETFIDADLSDLGFVVSPFYSVHVFKPFDQYIIEYQLPSGVEGNEGLARGEYRLIRLNSETQAFEIVDSQMKDYEKRTITYTTDSSDQFALAYIEYSHFNKTLSLDNFSINHSDVDTDGDGLSNKIETESYNTSIWSSDSDGDGLDDQMEIKIGTNPLDVDTDDDGFDDSYEVKNKYLDPLIKDTIIGSISTTVSI